jgi:hypothetical protein
MKTVVPSKTNLATFLPATTSCTITLREDQAAMAQQELEKLDFGSIKPASVALIGHEAEMGLSKTLDGFLANISRVKDPQLFALFDRLQDGIEEAKLPDLLKSIQSGKIGMLARIRGIFDKKAVANAAQAAYQSTCDMVSGRTNTLGGVIGKLEKELATAMSTLLAELRDLDDLQTMYKSRIDEFAISAALAQAFLNKSRAELEVRRKDLEGSQDPLAKSELETLEHKLQLVESRALALEGVYTKLPADRMVIQQIEAAGVQTLQETANTATTRFSSIKTTLIALHGALQVKGLQRLNAKHADLDRQLGQVRAALTKEVVATAANAPGDNRIEQAQQLQQIIALNGEIQSMVLAARAENKKKFEVAQQIFADARLELTSLSGQAEV